MRTVEKAKGMTIAAAVAAILAGASMGAMVDDA